MPGEPRIAGKPGAVKVEGWGNGLVKRWGDMAGGVVMRMS